MGLRGPAPKPTSLRLLEGNPGKIPLNPNEPQPSVISAHTPPEMLSEEAKKIWTKLSVMLVPVQLLTDIDWVAFGRYCELVVEFFRLRDFLTNNENKTVYAIYDEVPILGNDGLPIYEEDAKGVKRKKKRKQLKKIATVPQFNQMLRLSAELRKLEAEFGLTPSARSRINIDNGNTNPAGTVPSRKYSYSIPKRDAA